MNRPAPNFDYVLHQIWTQQYITISLLLITLAVGIFRYKKLANPERIIVWNVALGLLVEVMAIYVGFYLHINNNYCYNPFIIISFILYLLYYKNLEIQLPFWILLALLAVSSSTACYFEGWTNLSKYTFLAGSCIIIISVFYYFSDLLKRKQVFHLFKTPSFLISCGVLMYHIGVLPFVFFMEHIDFSIEINDTVLVLLNLIINLFLISAFICSNRKNHSKY